MKKRILLVEDTRALGENISDILRMEDYEVDIARHGVEAILMLDESSYDVIISDLVMPVMDGFVFIGQLRQHPKHFPIPVIVFSALRPEASRVEYLRMNQVNIILNKSVEIEILLNSISQVVGK